MAAKIIGKNVKYEVDGKTNVLTIQVDLNKSHGLSKSEKTVIIATTNGNTKIQNKDEDEVVFGLNVYRYPSEADSAPPKKSKGKKVADEDDEEE